MDKVLNVFEPVFHGVYDTVVGALWPGGAPGLDWEAMVMLCRWRWLCDGSVGEGIRRVKPCTPITATPSCHRFLCTFSPKGPCGRPQGWTGSYGDVVPLGYRLRSEFESCGRGIHTC